MDYVNKLYLSIAYKHCINLKLKKSIFELSSLFTKYFVFYNKFNDQRVFFNLIYIYIYIFSNICARAIDKPA